MYNDTHWMQVCDLETSKDSFDFWKIEKTIKLDIYEIAESFIEITEDEVIDFLKANGFIAPDVTQEYLLIDLENWFIEIDDARTKEPLYQLWAIPEKELDWREKRGAVIHSLS